MVERSEEYKALHKEVTNSLRKARRGYRSLKKEGFTSPATQAFKSKHGVTVDDLSLSDFNEDVSSLKDLKGVLDKYNSMSTRNISGARNWAKKIADTQGYDINKRDSLQLVKKRVELLNKLQEYRKSKPQQIETSERIEEGIDKYLYSKDISSEDVMKMSSEEIDGLIEEVSGSLDEPTELDEIEKLLGEL